MSELKAKNYNGKGVLDSREVAQMVGKRHDNLLRDIDGYIKILKEATVPNLGVSGNPADLKFEVSDFFIPDTYQDSTGRLLPCYMVTKKGCDMIANKLQGQKGVLFTAAYVTAFEEMQKTLAVPCKNRIPEGVSLGGLANLINATRRVMLDMGNSPVEIGAVTRTLFETCGIPLHEAFSSQIPGQLCFSGFQLPA